MSVSEEDGESDAFMNNSADITERRRERRRDSRERRRVYQFVPRSARWID